MRSLTANFDELIQRIQRGRDFAHASFEPIYYLIFRPSEILEVKRQLRAWTARLKQFGWKPHSLSLTDVVLEISQSAKTRNIWLKADARTPLDWVRTNKAIENALSNDRLINYVDSAIQTAAKDTDGILLITDLEALHPYTRIGAVETQLYGKIQVPTVILYPGERTGKTRLSFLGFYPEDGNYRSVHVGG